MKVAILSSVQYRHTDGLGASPGTLMVWALAPGLAGGLNGMSPDGPHVKAGETKPYTPHERVSRPEFGQLATAKATQVMKHHCSSASIRLMCSIHTRHKAVST